MLVRMQGKRNPHTQLVGIQASTTTTENNMEVPLLKIDLPYDPANPLLQIYLKDYDLAYKKGTCTPMFIAALFTIAMLWKYPSAPLLKNALRNCGICIQWNFTQPHRRMKFCHSRVNGWNWRTST
jgi:hypothetical protein